VSSWGATTRSRASAGATPVAVRIANGEVLRLDGFMAAVAGVARVPTRVSQAAGTVIGAARIIEKGGSNIRMSVFVSVGNNVGDIKRMLLHFSGMAGNPEILRLEGQLQHTRRSLEGLVEAGAAMDCPPAASIDDGVPVGDAHVVPPPAGSVVDPSVQLSPRAGSVAPAAPALESSPSSSLLATPSGTAGASSSRASPSNASYTFTDEELDEVFGPPCVDSLMRSQGTATRTRPSGSPEVLPVGAVPPVGGVPAVGDVPPVGNAPAVRDVPPVGGVTPVGGVETEYGDTDFDDHLVPIEGGHNIEADNGPVSVQPGVGAPPPLALIESQEAPAVIKPCKVVIRHLTKLLVLKGRKAQRVRDAFKSMISVVAAEHKCSLKVIQLCLLPWWPYQVSADPSVIFEPDAIWPLQGIVPERLKLTTKRSRAQDADGEAIITLEALPSVSVQIDKLVAGIMLLHNKVPLTQRTLANCVYLAQKAEHLSSAVAATEVAARLAAAKAAGAAARAAAAIPSTSAPRVLPIALSPAASGVLSVSPFPDTVPASTKKPLQVLGSLVGGVNPPAKPAGRPSPASRAASGRQPSVAEVRRTARAAAAQAAAFAVAVPSAPPAGEGAEAAEAKRRRVHVPTARRATPPTANGGADSVGVAGNTSSSMLCTTSGSCLLVSPAGVPVAEAETIFERTMLHGHPVPSDMVAVYVDVVIVHGHIYPHERRFPKELPATCDTRPMCELHENFILWEKRAVMKVGDDGECD